MNEGSYASQANSAFLVLLAFPWIPASAQILVYLLFIQGSSQFGFSWCFPLSVASAPKLLRRVVLVLARRELPKFRFLTLLLSLVSYIISDTSAWSHTD